MLPATGGHAEAALGQWSYCVGPCRGIELGDQLWVSRFILLRIADQFRYRASLEPKPVPGDWQGNGAHVKVRREPRALQGLVSLMLHQGRCSLLISARLPVRTGLQNEYPVENRHLVQSVAVSQQSILCIEIYIAVRLELPGFSKRCWALQVSTRETREAGRGWFALQEHVRRLGAAHGQHLMAYGAGAAARLGPSALAFRAVRTARSGRCTCATIVGF